MNNKIHHARRDETTRRIIELRPTMGPLKIAKELGMTRANVHHHLRKAKKLGWVAEPVDNPSSEA